MASALRDAASASGAGGRAEGWQLRYVRYEHAPGPPISEFAGLVGHGSYELAYRDAGLYSWLLSLECARCGRPLARFHELPQAVVFG